MIFFTFLILAFILYIIGIGFIVNNCTEGIGVLVVGTLILLTTLVLDNPNKQKTIILDKQNIEVVYNSNGAIINIDGSNRTYNNYNEVENIKKNNFNLVEKENFSYYGYSMGKYKTIEIPKE